MVDTTLEIIATTNDVMTDAKSTIAPLDECRTDKIAAVASNKQTPKTIYNFDILPSFPSR
jgi:hypothetical protein